MAAIVSDKRLAQAMTNADATSIANVFRLL
jgi:hypothetical protein